MIMDMVVWKIFKSNFNFTLCIYVLKSRINYFCFFFNIFWSAKTSSRVMFLKLYNLSVFRPFDNVKVQLCTTDPQEEGARSAFFPLSHAWLCLFARARMSVCVCVCTFYWINLGPQAGCYFHKLMLSIGRFGFCPSGSHDHMTTELMQHKKSGMVSRTSRWEDE